VSDVTVIEEAPEAVTAELPADTPAPAVGTAEAEDRSLDALLAEFDSVTAKPTEQPPAAENGAVSDNEVEKFLADLDTGAKDRQRITDLEGELNSVRAAEYQRQELAALDKFCGELQSQLGPNIPDDYAKASLLAMAAQDPNLEVAWKYRGLTNEQLANADKEFRELEALYGKLTHSQDNDPRKQQAIAVLESRGRELGLMMNARAVIANAKRSVIKRAEAHKVYDEDATLDRAAISQAIRDGQGPINIPERPPNFGTMTDAEFKNFTRKHYGF
jgi:hypothetical protein